VVDFPSQRLPARGLLQLTRLHAHGDPIGPVD
jgi:hypothetical protein